MLHLLLIRTSPLSFFIFFLFFGLSLKAQEDTSINENYHGFRLHISNVQIIKNKKEYYKISFNATNTGRKDLDIRPSKPQASLIVEYDRSLFNLKLGGYRPQIEHALKSSPIRLKVGEMAYNHVLVFSKLLPEEVIEAQQPIVKTTSEPKDNQPPFPKATIPEDNKKNEVFTTRGKKEVSVEELQKQKEMCPDLEFSKLRVIKQSDRWLTLEYTITNNGRGDAQLTGNQPIAEDNIAIRAYISGISKLSRGAITLGGIFVEDGVKNPKEVLAPGESYTAEMKLDIRKKTRYQNHLILSLDAFQSLTECDRTNNVESIILE